MAATSQATATSCAQASWDARTIAHSASAIPPLLDFHMSPSIAPFTRPQPLPLDHHWAANPQPPPPPPPSTNTASTTANSLPKDVALTLRREKELLEASVPITYTPATHRISKAKKGKRVHLCQFPGCKKIFTRAEHRRRHELNHNPQASFVCSVEGCGKGFHRHDLLTRHMEKHDSQARNRKPSPVQRRKSSQASVVSDKPASIPVPLPDHGLTPIPRALPITTTTTATTATSSLAPPPSTLPHGYGGEFTAPFWGQTGKPLDKSHTVPQTPYAHVDDVVPFSSPASSRSSSNSSPFPISSQFSVIEQFPEAVFSQQLTTSPTPMTSYPEWTPLEAAVTLPPQMLPTTQFGGDIPQTVGEPSLIYWTSNRKVVDPGPAVPVPLSNLDGVEWFALRRELTSTPGVLSGNDGLAIIDLSKWQDCFESYWQYFHPLFPIVHRSSFFSTKPSPLMAGAMVAIGSQYDRRPNSQEYSLALLEACQKILSKRGPITSRSRISDIQAVFLLEILSKYRSRKADVKVSHRLRTLYGSFIQDSHWASQNPLAAYQSLSQKPSTDDIRKAHKFWVEHETRRRVLQAAFILEVQQSLLFQQPLATFLQSTLDPTMREYRVSPKVDLPFPCSSELWESSDIEQWAQSAKKYDPLVSSSARERIIKSVDGSGIDLDPFQASLIFSQSLPNTSDLEDKMNIFIEKVAGKASSDDACNPRASYIRFMHHALLAAKHAPLQALLTVSGESWLFNRKVSETEFQTAKERVHAWVSNAAEAKTALWHAMHVLRCTIGPTDLNKSEVPIQEQRRASMDLHFSTPVQKTFLNSRHSTPGVSPTSQKRKVSAKDALLGNPTTTLQQPSASPLTMLQSNWILYFCSLICWAYENRTTASPFQITTNPSLSTPVSPIPPISVHQYITTFLSTASALRQFLDQPTPQNTLGHDLTSVIEHIRLIIFRNARGIRNDGGLLNEAERVLMRLIEQQQQRAKQHLHHFQRPHPHPRQVQHNQSHQQHQAAWEFVDSGF
ncbi:uncharacterized protein CIMG_01987 [Coccidioides immitis RS]|uniref:C2H2-type domain-containing protein n=2 Tax=Coccidioides immitis TaxID=5501 RepID=J3KKE2_COCIM|nr:uncharacterized protein CIMG_01987 [Coccidioides immitis RS]EAS36633.3 hypothetical protein CIMG_01987 [Coccidioides immitis RS]KMP02000.1 hypothetical protein CIRG_02139 [Coccidioides immitis RMSCC 2394]